MALDPMDTDQKWQKRIQNEENKEMQAYET